MKKCKQTRADMETANTCKVTMKKSQKVKYEKDQYKTKIHATIQVDGNSYPVIMQQFRGYLQCITHEVPPTQFYNGQRL